MAKKKTKANFSNQETMIKNRFELRHITPLTTNQQKMFNFFKQNKNLLLIGSAGSGKTFLSIYLALRDLLSDRENLERKIYICRSAEPSKNIGFLPGSVKEKTKVYEYPYQSIFSELFERGDSYDFYKNKGVIEFISTSFIRGLTLNNCVLIVDEVQNLEWNELYAIMTRIGKNCRVIFCGDYRQSDLKNNYRNDNRKDDILKFISVVKLMGSFETVEFGHNDIIRSDLVKEFIIVSENLGF